MLERAQRTLKREVRYSGIGVHLGKSANLLLRPAKENTGIVFYRDGLSDETPIPALLSHVSGTGRCTTLSSGQATLATVEHLMAALRSCGVDNAIIHCDGDEIPFGDGSSRVFMRLIDQAGVMEQEAAVSVAKLPVPVYHQSKDGILAAFPADEFKISYTLNYPQNAIIGTQYHSLVITEESFRREIAPCRTFALYSELCYLIDRGLIGGGSLSNAVIFKDDGVISKGGLRFPNEPVRHKMLDMIGDLALVGRPFMAHIVSVGSGHTTNVALGKKIVEALQI